MPYKSREERHPLVITRQINIRRREEISLDPLLKRGVEKLVVRRGMQKALPDG